MENMECCSKCEEMVRERESRAEPGKEDRRMGTFSTSSSGS